LVGDVRDVGLDATAPQGVAVPATTLPTAAGSLPSPPPGVIELAATQAQAAPGTTASGRASVRAASRYRVLYLAMAALGVAHVAYFVARFVVAGHAPELHAVFRGGHAREGGAFGSMNTFDGPWLTIASILLVAVTFLAVSAWVTHHHRRDPMVQLLGALSVIAGQFSLSVTVLTSSDTFLPTRLLAAAIYVVMPAASLAVLLLFPSGRAVPRWGLKVLPLAIVPFVIQAREMFVHRVYSLPVAATFFPIAVMFLGFQWHRYRRCASLREQHQILWLSYSAIVFVGLQAIAVVGVLPQLSDPTRASFPFFKLLFELLLASSYLLGLGCLLFSAARYRLWDVDRVINRTIVYVLVTGVIAAMFVVAFYALRAAIGVYAPTYAVAAASALVVLVFVPARRRVARWIDRRFYGIGLDYEALASKAVHAARTTLPGTVFAAYDELALLGRGGMGAVYRAHHAELALPVALKVMSPDLAGDPAAQRRFSREAQILEGLRHPNIMPFIASGHEHDLAYIAMPYIAGEDLASVVRRCGPLSLEDTLAILDGIAAALDAAHARGVIHRDVKPANVLLEGQQPALATRRPVLADFGVALLVGDRSPADDGSMVGTLAYVAPEQIHDANAVDGRADIYALAAVTFELLTGRPPFREPTALGLVMAHLRQPPPDPRDLVPELPAPVAAALLAGLAKDRAARPATAAAFVASLRVTPGRPAR
jgi:hypothetical protein